MALISSIESIVQSNDTTVLRITDGSGLYNATTNPGGWLGEADSIPTTQPKASAVNGSTVHLYLDIAVTKSDNVTTTYDQIELYDEFGPFTDVTDLVFDIDCTLLQVSSVAIGTATDSIPDGWYTITYSFVDDGSSYTDSTVTSYALIDGIVRNKVYNELRDVPYSTEWIRYSNDFTEWTNILYPLYYYSLLQGMVSEVSNARKTEVLEMLATLERILVNTDL